MIDGVYPSTRHDGGAWLPSDSRREALAGSPLGFRAILLFTKLDWMEMASTVGFPTWADGMRPCPKCNVFGDGIRRHRGASIASFPFREIQDINYFNACDWCEIICDLMPEARRLIVEGGGLQADKRTDGSRGLALQRDVPALGPAKYDRVEPSELLPVPADIMTVDLAVSRRVVVWRPSRETLTRHRCPHLQPQPWHVAF